eukprot:6226440-Amphidinium_carterae.1
MCAIRKCPKRPSTVLLCVRLKISSGEKLRRSASRLGIAFKKLENRDSKAQVCTIRCCGQCSKGAEQMAATPSMANSGPGIVAHIGTL